MANPLKVIGWLYLKDLMVEARRPYEVVSIISFPIIGSITFTLLGGQSPWNGLTFSALITLFTSFFVALVSFTREYDKRTMYSIKSLPVEPQLVYISKTLFSFTMIIAATMASLIGTGVMASGIFGSPWTWAVYVLLGVNLAAVTSLVSAITMYSEGKYVLIPLLTLVFAFPVILLTSSALRSLVAGLQPLREMEILALHFILFTAVASLLMGIIVED